MIAFAQANSQSFILPTKIVDSLIFEVKKGRQCDSLQQAQFNEIKKLGDDLLANGKIITLQKTENKQLSDIIITFQEEKALLEEKFVLKVEDLKTKIKHLWIGILSEGVVIILLILII
ncbi:MAG: hypothetical protein BWY74_01622 [Firmicutes bacterium ADurb.Bin419]|nr:MAG: hypothetical protein BWY74_01622 [Firmicutes bacterium ADurb.Bin419]